MMNLLVTGGCGFIGSNFIEMVLKSKREHINKISSINLKILEYSIKKKIEKNKSDSKKIIEIVL